MLIPLPPAFVASHPLLLEHSALDESKYIKIIRYIILLSICIHCLSVGAILICPAPSLAIVHAVAVFTGFFAVKGRVPLRSFIFTGFAAIAAFQSLTQFLTKISQPSFGYSYEKNVLRLAQIIMWNHQIRKLLNVKNTPLELVEEVTSEHPQTLVHTIKTGTQIISSVAPLQTLLDPVLNELNIIAKLCPAQWRISLEKITLLVTILLGFSEAILSSIVGVALHKRATARIRNVIHTYQEPPNGNEADAVPLVHHSINTTTGERTEYFLKDNHDINIQPNQTFQTDDEAPPLFTGTSVRLREYYGSYNVQ